MKVWNHRIQVCSSGFTDAEARVACRQMGYCCGVLGGTSQSVCNSVFNKLLTQIAWQLGSSNSSNATDLKVIDLKLRLQWAQDRSQHLDVFLFEIIYTLRHIQPSSSLDIRFQPFLMPSRSSHPTFAARTHLVVWLAVRWFATKIADVVTLLVGSPQGLLWRDQDRLKPKERTSKFHEMIPRAPLLSMSLDLRLRAAFGRMRSEQ